jgi:putative transposase
MPGRNILKHDVADSYYHVYARGVNKQELFLDASDYTYFLSLFKRYLSTSESPVRRGSVYHCMHSDIQLLSYCLMSNHIHMLVYQINPGSMPTLMKCILTAYSMYFNKKYQRSGPLFGSRYRASRISSEGYLLHISRYIHLNPMKWRTYDYSSLPWYLDHAPPDWVDTAQVKSLFGSADELDILKHELANQ